MQTGTTNEYLTIFGQFCTGIMVRDWYKPDNNTPPSFYLFIIFQTFFSELWTQTAKLNSENLKFKIKQTLKNLNSFLSVAENVSSRI